MSGSSSTESTRSLRPRSSTRPLFELERVIRLAEDLPVALARDRGEPQLVGAAGQQDRHEPRVQQLAQAPGDQVEQAVELRLGGEGVADLVQRLELLRPPVAAS